MSQSDLDFQSRLPPGHGFLGIIGASDKTALTVGTGGKEMHPFLLSIANIDAGVRMKASSHAFALAAYLPIPKFCDVSKHVHAILCARVYHKCISIVTQSLKDAEAEGAVMSNPWGNLNAIHTPLVSWIADYPEQLLISCTAAKHSPVSIASSLQFGDNVIYSPRTRDVTLSAIYKACDETDPWDIPSFYKTTQRYHLNGVYQPFWEDWGIADPSLFLTPDALHQWHKFFYDHVVKWVINIMGGPELDYRLQSLQPRVGSKHWGNGVSKLKQCTGREHRELETLIVAVAAGAVPDSVLCAIRALLDFIYQAQNVYHYDDTLYALTQALDEFHSHKFSILEAGGRTGKTGALNHFQIPKLELMQQVVRSIKAMGASYQWTSDVTERCHIVLVKRPYRSSNRRDFHAQCCRFLDREEKIRFFSLFVVLKMGNVPLLNLMHQEATEMASHYPEHVWISRVLPDEHQVGVVKAKSSLFARKGSHISADQHTAFHLTQRPHWSFLAIDDAATLFSLPDLRPALGDWFSGLTYLDRNGQRRSPPDCPLPFTHVHVWNNVRVQQYSAQDSRSLVPVQTIHALPPSTSLPHGRSHTVLVNHAGGDHTSYSGDEREFLSFSIEGKLLTQYTVSTGCSVMDVRMIFQPVFLADQAPVFLFYGRNFKFIQGSNNQGPNNDVLLPSPGIDMFLLRRHCRANGTPMGDIMDLGSICQQVQLVPKFGQKAMDGMDCNNSMDKYEFFYLNNFAHKETFHSILSYQ